MGKPEARTSSATDEDVRDLAGSPGRAFLARFVELGWARVDRTTRIVAFTPTGLREFRAFFDLSMAA
jgi:hypothetical protein